MIIIFHLNRFGQQILLIIKITLHVLCIPKLNVVYVYQGRSSLIKICSNHHRST